jgi:GAF domain/PilZ domain/Sel1 repeat
MESSHTALSAEITPGNVSSARERRRTPRHRVLNPSYANLSGSAQGAVLELNEILDISESGMCMQAASAMTTGQLLPLGIDLSQAGDTIHTVGYVAWSESSGKTGIQFPEIAEGARLQLRRWLAANGGAAASPGEGWAEITKEVEGCGDDVEAALDVIGQQALRATRASGAAVALVDELNPDAMVCRARAGTDAPGVGARLETGSGFSGQCVGMGVTLKCDDAESDSRVDRESCRALGIRAMVACPVKREGKVIGILEVFSREVGAFGEDEVVALERLAGMIVLAAGRGKVVEFPIASLPNSAEAAGKTIEDAESSSGRRLGRGMLFLLVAVVCIGAAVWMGTRWLAGRKRAAANVTPAASAAAPSRGNYIGEDLKDVQKHADAGDAEAEYEMGVRYASGIDVTQDYVQAMRWFLQAADLGSARAQGRVATWMFLGRGAEQDYSKAYYWGLLAQAGGDDAGRTIVVNSAPYLSPVQIAEEQRQAENWLHGHHIGKAEQ